MYPHLIGASAGNSDDDRDLTVVESGIGDEFVDVGTRVTGIATAGDQEPVASGPAHVEVKAWDESGSPPWCCNGPWSPSGDGQSRIVGSCQCLVSRLGDSFPGLTVSASRI